MSLFFAPRKPIRVPRPVAIALNVLNLLAPVFLALAVVLIGSTKIGSVPASLHRPLSQWAACLVAAALLIRFVWAICIRMIRRKDEG